MIRKKDFMCICSEEGRAKCDALMKRVYEEIGCKEDKDFLSYLTYAMQLGEDDVGYGMPEGFYAQIEGIGVDQWFGVSVKVLRRDKETKKYVDHASIWVPCDRVEHGLARAYGLAKETVNEVEDEKHSA